MSKDLKRSPAKIFSKLQKHLDIISKVETALYKIKKSEVKEASSEPITMLMSQKEFSCLSKYLSLSVGLKDFYKEATVAKDQKISPYIPQFIQ